MRMNVADMILNEGPLMAVKDSAKLIGVSTRTMHTMTKEPGFPIIRVSERRVAIPRGALLRWLEEKNGAC